MGSHNRRGHNPEKNWLSLPQQPSTFNLSQSRVESVSFSLLCGASFLGLCRQMQLLWDHECSGPIIREHCLTGVLLNLWLLHLSAHSSLCSLSLVGRDDVEVLLVAEHCVEPYWKRWPRKFSDVQQQWLREDKSNRKDLACVSAQVDRPCNHSFSFPISRDRIAATPQVTGWPSYFQCGHI